MSRVGKKSIIVPENIEVKIDSKTDLGQKITVKGEKGELFHIVNPLVFVSLDEVDGKKEINFKVNNENDVNERAQWGTARSIVANLIKGVVTGFSKQLEVNGVGYRVNLSGNTIVLNVGFSHEVKFELPEGIEAQIEGNVITISGIDKQKVGQIASEIRSIKKPEPYKGKGIKYIDEVIRRKAGKTAKGAD